jgi:hypothetical protein
MTQRALAARLNARAIADLLRERGRRELHRNDKGGKRSCDQNQPS